MSVRNYKYQTCLHTIEPAPSCYPLVNMNTLSNALLHKVEGGKLAGGAVTAETLWRAEGCRAVIVLVIRRPM